MTKTVKKLFFLFIFIFSMQRNSTIVLAEGAETNLAYEEAVEQGYHTFKYRAPSVSTSSTFWIYDSNNPDAKVTISPDQEVKVPNSWYLGGEIIVEPGNIFSATGDSLRTTDNLATGKKSDFTIDVTGEGDEAYLTYTLNGYQLQENLSLVSWQSTFFNFAEYRLNGGTWTDSKGTYYPGCNSGCNKGEYYRLHIAPYQSVYKPEAPTKEGYTFLGWSAKSTLTAENNKNPDYYTWENPYPFEEIDPNLTLNYSRGKNVVLTASWAKNPALEVKDIEIYEGDSFDQEDLIVSVTNDEGKSVKYTPEFDGDYDNGTAGKYPIVVTVTDSFGGTTTKTANLIVKKRWTPIIPTPILTVEDKEIFVGDEFDPKDMVMESDGEVKIELPEKYDTDTEGEYTITFTVINRSGSKTTKTAVLTVKPEEPTKPEDPEKPIDPETSVDPGKAVDPEKQVEPNKPVKPSPKTGDIKIASYAVLSWASLAGLAVVSKKKED